MVSVCGSPCGSPRALGSWLGLLSVAHSSARLQPRMPPSLCSQQQLMHTSCWRTVGGAAGETVARSSFHGFWSTDVGEIAVSHADEGIRVICAMIAVYTSPLGQSAGQPHGPPCCDALFQRVCWAPTQQLHAGQNACRSRLGRRLGVGLTCLLVVPCCAIPVQCCGVACPLPHQQPDCCSEDPGLGVPDGSIGRHSA